jgi:RNA polymerase sigma-70 factor (ECF subfamily)
LTELSIRSVMTNQPVYHERFLISKLSKGDEDAFNCIFNMYYKGLVLYANKFLLDRDKAEEAVQGIFVKLWSGREQIIINTSIKTYLRKSVQNKCLDILKHKKVVQDYVDKVGRQPVEQTANSTDLILFAELNEKIEYSINNLPENCREIFKLSRYEGLKYVEIAQKMNISIKTVEVQIGKALKKLRDDLKQYLT